MVSRRCARALVLAAFVMLQSSACAHVTPTVEGLASMNLGFEELALGIPQGWVVGPLSRFEVSSDKTTVRSGARSVRISSRPGGGYGSLSRRIDADPLVGKRVRLHGWVQTKAVTGWAAVWLRVDGGQSTYVMADGPLGSSSGWSEIVADAMISPGTDLTFGVALGGTGTAWFDDLSLEIIDPPSVLPIELAGRVVDPAGLPVAGAEVALIAPSGGVEQHVRTTDAGAFSLRTNTGKWALSASVPHRPEWVGTFLPTRQWDQNEAPVLALSSDAGVRVQGQLADAVPDTYVSVAAYSPFSGDVWAVPVGPDGGFAATLTLADRFALSVLSGGFGKSEARRDGGVASATIDVIPQRPAPAAVSEWIAKNAIPFTTVDPSVPLENREALRRLVGGARVVGLGEATHGTREFFQLKHRLFRALVEEGFTVFALELGQVEARAINAYVVNGTGTARTALGGAAMWVWETEEVIALIEWMRAWNADPRHFPKLQFVGFDMQSSIASLKAVTTFLQQVAPAEASTWLAPLEVLGHESGAAGFKALPAQRQVEVVAAVASLNERFVASQKDWQAASSPAAFAVARQDARVLQQAAAQFSVGTMSKEGGAMRDQAMAENIKWLHDTLPPGARMVVSAHNLHVAEVKGRMGHFLRATLGSTWLAIALEFGDGTFQALRARTDGARPNIEAISLARPRVGLANTALLESGPGIYALDLRALPQQGEVAAWFRSPQLVREVGYVFQSEAALTVPQVLAERFDALLFVGHTTRARPLEVDFTRVP